MDEASPGVTPPIAEPVSIGREDDGAIRIEWDDGRLTVWSPKQLRDACPCATCRERRRGSDASTTATARGAKTAPGLPVLSAAEARPLTITGMQPVGRYAYQIGFSDGHRSGLFPLNLLYNAPENPSGPGSQGL